MEVKFTTKSLESLNYWKSTNNTKVLKRIKQLILSIKLNPFTGIGKPEPQNNSYLVIGQEELILKID